MCGSLRSAQMTCMLVRFAQDEMWVGKEDGSPHSRGHGRGWQPGVTTPEEVKRKGTRFFASASLRSDDMYGSLRSAQMTCMLVRFAQDEMWVGKEDGSPHSRGHGRGWQPGVTTPEGVKREGRDFSPPLRIIQDEMCGSLRSAQMTCMSMRFAQDEMWVGKEDGSPHSRGHGRGWQPGVTTPEGVKREGRDFSPPLRSAQNEMSS